MGSISPSMLSSLEKSCWALGVHAHLQSLQRAALHLTIVQQHDSRTARPGFGCQRHFHPASRAWQCATATRCRRLPSLRLQSPSRHPPPFRCPHQHLQHRPAMVYRLKRPQQAQRSQAPQVSLMGLINAPYKDPNASASANWPLKRGSSQAWKPQRCHNTAL